MALLYKTVRDNREESDHLYYGRAVHLNTIQTNDLADIIQRNCSMKRSDVLAVLTELVEVMSDQLKNSMIVKLNGFGSFKLGITSSGTVKEEDYNPLKNVKGLHVNFLPEGKRISGSKKMTRTFLDGCKLQKYE